MKSISKYFSASLLLIFLSPVSYALTSGTWGATVSCGPREDLSPVRPGFSRVLPTLNLKNETAVLSHTYKEFGKVDVNENWKIKVVKDSVSVSGDATRSTNGEQWQYSFSGNSSGGNSFELNGSMVSAEQKKIRDCKFALNLVSAEVQPTQRVSSPTTTVTTNKSTTPKLAPAEPIPSTAQPSTTSKQAVVAPVQPATQEIATLKEEPLKNDAALEKSEEKVTSETNPEPVKEVTVVKAEDKPKAVEESNIYFWIFDHLDKIVIGIVLVVALMVVFFVIGRIKKKQVSTVEVANDSSKEIEELKRQLQVEKERSSKISQELNSLNTASSASTSVASTANPTGLPSEANQDVASSKSLKSQLEEKMAAANVAGNLNKAKAFIFSVLEWCAKKWAPIKSKILNSKFGIKYPRFAKFISNGWVVLFLVASLGGGGKHSDRDYGNSNSYEDDPRANSSECRWATQTAKEICSSLKYDSGQYMRCLRDQINARGTCPRI